MAASRPSLPRQLQTHALLCLLLLGSLGGGLHYALGRQQIAQRLNTLHTLVEQRFVGVLAQSVWDLDQNNTQQLLLSINHLDGVNRVDLDTTLGQHLSSQLDPDAHSEWIRDFPIQSERTGNQPIATLHLYLGREQLEALLLWKSSLYAAGLMLAMLVMWQLCRRFMLRRILQPLATLGQQWQDGQATEVAAPELATLGRQLQRYHQHTRRQLEQQVRHGHELQKQRDQLNELLTLRQGELEQLALAQQLLSKLSGHFLHLPDDELEDALRQALGQIGQLLNVDRCYLFRINPQQAISDNIEWCADGVSSTAGFYEHYPLQRSAWLIPQLRQQQLVISRLEQIPPEGHGERLRLAEHAIQSITVVALKGGGQMLGFFGCDMVKQQHDWLDKELTLVRLFGDMLSCVLLRRHQQQALARQQEQLAAANASLYAMAHSDGLTGLANPQRLQQEKQLLFERAFLQQQALSAIAIDIDQFKSYNEYAGHQAGDACLISVARVLQQHGGSGKGALVVRVGGAGFLLLLPQLDGEQALAMAETLRQAVLDLHIPHPASVVSSLVTISLGVATLSLRQHDNVDDLLRDAEQALGLAKQQGRNRSQLAPAM